MAPSPLCSPSERIQRNNRFMTHEELLQAARWCPFNRKTLRELGAHLPPDEPALDRLLAAAIQARDDAAFSNLLFAALAAGRPPDARHLVQGTARLPLGDQLISAAWHLPGDVAGALLQAVQTGGLFYETQATALMMAGIWSKCKKRIPIHPEIIVHARMVARQIHEDPLPLLDLSVLASLADDKAFTALLASLGQIVRPQQADKAVDIVLKLHRDSPTAFIPEDGDPFAVLGQTVRRKTPAVGRNDPCPCGSGKKYKKCCLDKDQGRSRHSPSLTDLLALAPPPIDEARLTLDQIRSLTPRELLQLDVTKIPRDRVGVYLRALLSNHEDEEAVRAMEKAGPFDDREDWWEEVLYSATHIKNRTLVRRLLDLRVEPGFKLERVPSESRLLLAAEYPNPALDLIEAEALKGLRDPKSEDLIGLGYALLDGDWPALGILFTRGLLNTAQSIDAWMLLEGLLTARDRLNLDPEDPAEDIYDQRFLVDDDEPEQRSPELTQNRLELQANQEEMRRLRQKLVELEKELERKARLKGPPPAPATPSAPAPPKPSEDAALLTLRQELEALKNELKNRHGERNQLRRELQETLTDLEHLKKHSETTPATAPAPESKDELELFGAADPAAETSQVIRVPEFPKKFSDQLHPLPKPAIRHALALIGRLAAGEPAAFQGMKRLALNREICRQRVGMDHRLLFRLKPQTLEVIALINRRDLDRTVRNLI